MNLKLNITKALCFISLLVSLGLPELMSNIGEYIIYSPSKLEFNKPLGLILPYLFNPRPLGFILGMYIFNYNSSKLEEHYKSKKYAIILLLSLILTSFMGLVVGLTFKNLFEYPEFYNSSWFGIMPINLCLRCLYYNKIDRDVMIFANEVNSKNIIWIELLILNIVDPYHNFGIQLGGVLAGHILYNIL
jgi:hypothetical protein